MFKVLKSLPLVLCLVLLVMCQKKTTGTTDGTGGPDKKKPAVTTMFAKYDWVLCYTDQGHLGKKRSQLDDLKAKYDWLKFGNKVTVTEEKEAGGDLYYGFKTPSGGELWASAASLTKQYVIINSSDIPTYSEPDSSYGLKIKLQPGMLGFLQEEKDGWYKIEVWAYSREDPKKWSGGTFWIQKGFTNDLTTAKQAYLYYQAQVQEVKQNKIDKAIEVLTEAIDLGNTDIINTLEEYRLELESKAGK